MRRSFEHGREQGFAQPVGFFPGGVDGRHGVPDQNLHIPCSILSRQFFPPIPRRQKLSLPFRFIVEFGQVVVFHEPAELALEECGSETDDDDDAELDRHVVEDAPVETEENLEEVAVVIGHQAPLPHDPQ